MSNRNMKGILLVADSKIRSVLEMQGFSLDPY